MAIFQELELTESFSDTYGVVLEVDPESLAAELGILPGDHLLTINGNTVEDVIDVQFYSAEEEITLVIRRGDDIFSIEAIREYGEPLGLVFEHPTFDTDIRRCNNLCEFCFVLQMAPRFRKTLYIKDDDYRYSFLFGHYVTLTNLSEHDWWRIRTMGLSPLYISVHVTDWEKRRAFLRNKKAPDIMPQLRKLAGWGIEIHTQLVIVPEFNDGEWLKRSIAELSTLWPTVQSVSVVPVGLTAHHKYKMRTHTIDEVKEMITYVHDLQKSCQKKFDRRFLYLTDEWYLRADLEVPGLEAYDDQALHENGLGMVRSFLDEWNALQEEIDEWLIKHDDTPLQRKNLTLITASLFAPTLRHKAELLNAKVPGVNLDVVEMVNIGLGESITVAGLLLAKDVIFQLKTVELGEMIILPRVMFDHPRTITLDDYSQQEVANELQCPVALADSMGDVWDVLTGASTTILQPQPQANE